MIRRVGATLLALVCLPVLAQGIYTWRDASGRVHYSDMPPPDGKARQLRAADQPATNPQAEAKTPAEKPRTGRKEEPQEAKAQPEASREQAELRAQDCALAREQLAALESGRRVSRKKADGEREYLDNSQRIAEIERTRRYITESCGQ